METLFSTTEYNVKQHFECQKQEDWTGNYQSTCVTNGFANFRNHAREQHDYYATEPKAAELLLKLEKFTNVWECACGGGHLANVFRKHNILGRESDIIDRYGNEVLNFLYNQEKWNGDIVTNPPYKYSLAFIETALNAVYERNKVAMLLPIRYLEGLERKKFYAKNPPKRIYVSSGRLRCACNGDFKRQTASAVCYMWVIFEKGYKGQTVLKWFN
jgi:hypothetical protein